MFGSSPPPLGVEEALRQSERLYQQMAHVDYLTGLSNRRSFMEQAELEFTRTSRYGGDLSLFMLGLDHFKKINDCYGHQIGDLVLQQFRKTSQAALRDVIGRLGGEEFAVLVPETDLKEAVEMAERLRKLIASITVPLDAVASIQFTVSIGVASLTQCCANIATLVINADHGLYKAKENGRNKVYPVLS
jgi:diguanylate cyclase (GGDEF)-like protein